MTPFTYARANDAAEALTLGALAGAKPETQCNLTIAMTDAIGDLPQPVRGKVARSIIVG